MLPDNRLGDLKAVELPRAPKGFLSWFLTSTGIGDLLLNLRTSEVDSRVKQWLHSPLNSYYGNWVANDDSQFVGEFRLIPDNDGILFVSETTPSRPTVNALKTVANREGI